MEEIGREVVEKLRESVKLRLIADVPVGVFLSGGVDSSAVVALMSELEAPAADGVSVGFAEAEFNELPHARQIARRFAAEHQEIVVKPEDICERPATPYRVRDEPVAEPTA